MKKKTSLKVACSVIIHNPDKMTIPGRKRIAKWIRSRASWLEKHGDLASGRFTQRYYYEPSQAN